MIPHTTPFSLKNTWCLLLCYLWVTTILVFLPFTHNINIYTHSSQWVPPNAPSSAHLYRYSTATSPTPFLAPYSQPPNFTCFVSFSIPLQRLLPILTSTPIYFSNAPPNPSNSPQTSSPHQQKPVTPFFSCHKCIYDEHHKLHSSKSCIPYPSATTLYPPHST